MLAEVHVVEGPEALAAAAAARVATACHRAVALRGRAVLALAGGATPLRAYRLLAERHDVPWERVVVAWGDERHVPRDHPDRNERAARTALLDHVPVRPEHVLSWGEGPDANVLAEAYARTLVATLGEPPRFDLVLLGLGADAHTASLFPDHPALAADGLTVAVEGSGGSRLTLTAPALSHAEEVLVLVSGAAKRSALARTLAASAPDAALPLTLLRPGTPVTVLADAEAAASASGPGDGPRVEG